MKTLRETNYKKFKIEVADNISKEYFNIDGISNVEINQAKASFIFKGDINLVIDKIHSQRVLNLLVEEPTLEEIFMHYYVEEE